MRKWYSIRRVGVVAALGVMVALLPAGVSGASPTPTWKTIDVPGSQWTKVLAINDLGTLVGSYGAAGTTNGFVDRNGTFTTINDPSGAEGTFPTGVNDLGKIVGSYTDADGVSHGFADQKGTFTTINAPGAGTGSGQGTYASQLNNLGVIVGYFVDSGGVQHGYTERNGSFTDVNAPSAGTTSGYGTFLGCISDLGVVSGNTDNSTTSSQYSFEENGSGYTTITDASAVPGESYIGCDNDLGLAVGVYYTSAEVAYGFSEWGGTYTTLSDPSAGTGAPVSVPGLGQYDQGTAVEDDNNLGQTVGFYVTSGGAALGFVLSY